MWFVGLNWLLSAFGTYVSLNSHVSYHTPNLPSFGPSSSYHAVSETSAVKTGQPHALQFQVIGVKSVTVIALRRINPRRLIQVVAPVKYDL